MKNVREFLNKLQIAYKARSVFVKVYSNVENLKLIYFFYEKGWIKMYSIKNNEIIIYLRYINNKPLFSKIKCISTSGHRKYFSKESLKFFKKYTGGNTNILLYTSFGLKTLQFVEKMSIGGEISYMLYE